MTEQKTTSANTDFLLTVVIALSAVTYKFSQSEEFRELQETLPRTLLLFAIILAAATALVLLLVRVIKQRLAERDQREEQELHERQVLSQLEKLRKTVYANTNETTRAYLAAGALREQLPQHLQGRARRIQHYILRVSERLEETELNTAEEQRERTENTARLVTFFSKHRSTTLPRWALHFDKEVIDNATTEYEQRKEREYDPPEPSPVAAFLLESRFYRANKLSAQQREALLKNGYRLVPFVHLDGRTGNNLIIKNNPVKESDYHFCMKHLFSELDSRVQIEYPLAGQRYDVVYYRDLHRLAVEIETGTNKPAHIRKKVAALSRYFDHWIIITNRQNKPFYQQYVDNEQSFCLTAKHAAEKVRAILASYPDS